MSSSSSIAWGDVVSSEEFDFLPPVDDTIFDSILSTNVESSSSDPPRTQPKRVRGRTYRTELLSLHETKAELEKAVLDLEHRRKDRTTALSGSDRKWEQIARNQLELKLKALRENEELRAAVVEQHNLTKELESIVYKKPRRMMVKMDDDKWRVLKLSAHAEKRLAAIHLIANRQLDAIESDMVTTGLVDSTADSFSVRPFRTGADLFVEGYNCAHFHQSMDAVADAVWRTMKYIHANAKTSALPSRVHSFEIDQDTVFIRAAFESAVGPTKVESCVILKRQKVHANHFRMVFRSVLDDEADPFDQDSYVSDLHGWVDLELAEDGETVLYRGYAKAKYLMDAHEHANMADVVALMESLHLEEGSSLKFDDDDPIQLADQVFRASFQSFLTLLHAFLEAEPRDT